jgi:hypothetical protein
MNIGTVAVQMRNTRVFCSFPAKYFIANAMTAGNASQKLVNGILAALSLKSRYH